MIKTIKVRNISVGGGSPLLIIAGPCVIEDKKTTIHIARYLKELSLKLDVPLIFKASYDKANRTSVNSFRGPGINRGLDILEKIKSELGLVILSDVHSVNEIKDAAGVLDIIQIPAFLSRQTDFILEIARAGKPVNIKKGQFLAPWDIKNVVEKITSTGNTDILITERGTMYGYNNLVVDFRGIQIMHDTGYPVIFDATHSVQLPGGGGNRSGGDRKFVPALALAAVAAGADGIFMEVHPDPDRALCDGPNSLQLDSLNNLIIKLKAIREAISRAATDI
ncbi:MAG: 3-deoxy-8-phosphooctulonate synthase [Desulfobacteraceae bacterium]|nr:MAG: 3-deoxy-8-phosphooctulonate synthase [Desulfobacteraceae bacterium]